MLSEQSEKFGIDEDGPNHLTVTAPKIMIDELLECAKKRIPKDVVLYITDNGDNGKTETVCPSCHAIFEMQDIGNAYCLDCGQKLRWTNKVCEVE